MVRIFDRYIGRQILFATAFAAVVLTVVLVLGNMFKELFDRLTDNTFPVSAVFEFIKFVIPYSLILTIPWGFLTSMLLVFGRLSADNELISMRMTGLSMGRICLPVFAIALALCGVSFWFNASVAPEGEARMKRVLYQMATDDPMTLFQPGQTVTALPGYIMWAQDRQGDELINFHAIQLNENKQAANTYIAKRVKVELQGVESLAEITGVLGDQDRTGSAGELVLNFQDVHLDIKDSADPFDFQRIQHGAFLRESSIGISLEPLREKAKEITPSMMRFDALREKMADPALTGEHRSELRTEFSKRISLSLACLTFAFVAIPLGITAQRRETSIGFVLSLAVVMIYFMFIVIADMNKSDPGAYPHILMLLPNAIFMAIGGFLFYRLSKR